MTSQQNLPRLPATGGPPTAGGKRAPCRPFICHPLRDTPSHTRPERRGDADPLCIPAEFQNAKRSLRGRGGRWLRDMGFRHGATYATRGNGADFPENRIKNLREGKPSSLVLCLTGLQSGEGDYECCLLFAHEQNPTEEFCREGVKVEQERVYV